MIIKSSEMVALVTERGIIAGENHLQYASIMPVLLLGQLAHALLEELVGLGEHVSNPCEVLGPPCDVVLEIIRINDREPIHVVVCESRYLVLEWD